MANDSSTKIDRSSAEVRNIREQVIVALKKQFKKSGKPGSSKNIVDSILNDSGTAEEKVDRAFTKAGIPVPKDKGQLLEVVNAEAIRRIVSAQAKEARESAATEFNSGSNLITPVANVVYSADTKRPSPAPPSGPPLQPSPPTQGPVEEITQTDESAQIVQPPGWHDPFVRPAPKPEPIRFTQHQSDSGPTGDTYIPTFSTGVEPPPQPEQQDWSPIQQWPGNIGEKYVRESVLPDLFSGRRNPILRSIGQRFFPTTSGMSQGTIGQLVGSAGKATSAAKTVGTAAKLAPFTTTAAAGTGFSAFLALNAVPIALIVIGILLLIIILVTFGGTNGPEFTIMPVGNTGLGASIPGSYDCKNKSMPKPTNVSPIFSSDHKFAYPLVGSTSMPKECRHWDYSLAVDIFTGQTGVNDPEKNMPTVAYTSGTIKMISMNDSLGGIYIILAGDDGRYYYYAHHCSIYVSAGQRVAAGEVIGITDQTGMNAAVTPEHLHFAINSNQPNFFSGGTVCPFTDFREKFNISVCDPSMECRSK